MISAQVPDMVLFAKTTWLQRKVAENHNVTVHKVLPSLDLSAFDNARQLHRQNKDEVHVVAMVRPSTPRRNPRATIQVLKDIKDRYPTSVIHTFGCSFDELSQLDDDLDFDHRGTLARDEVADLFAKSDIFSVGVQRNSCRDKRICRDKKFLEKNFWTFFYFVFLIFTFSAGFSGNFFYFSFHFFSKE